MTTSIHTFAPGLGCLRTEAARSRMARGRASARGRLLFLAAAGCAQHPGGGVAARTRDGRVTAQFRAFPPQAKKAA